MKPIHIFLLILVAALAGGGGWFAAKHSHGSGPGQTADSGVIYTCSMHPQVRQKKPGTCPFCGMALAPLSQAARSDLPEGSVMLSSNRVNAINVQTVEARRQPLRRTLRVAGVIDDNDARHRIMSAYIEGRIDKLFVNFTGAEVKEGQPLAAIYSPMLLAAEQEYAALAKRKPAEASPLHDEHRRIVDAARQRLRRLGLNDAQIATLPDKPADAIHTEILAPMSGTVVARMAYEGQYVKEGEKLFELADFATMWFRFDAYERDLAWLKPGQSVEVTTPSAPGRTFTAPIAFIDPNLSDPTRSAKVRVEIPNPLVETNGSSRRELLHKLFAEGVVKVDAPDTLSVPRSAVLAPGRPYVFVDKGGGIYEQRKLQLGRAGDELWEVLDGLQEGERVVTTGNLLIDSQAQLDSGAAPAHEHGAGTEPPSVAPTNLPPLTDEQREAATNLLAFADSLTASLAADDLGRFNELAAKSHSSFAALVAEFAQDSPWRLLVGKIEAPAHVASATDLRGARKNFHPLSEASVAFVKALRRQEAAFKTLKVFRCPMTKDAFSGAPRTAEWLQLQPQIRNPYFGAEMLDCGSEVKL